MSRQFRLDSLINYRIKVDGLLGENCSDWLDLTTVSLESDTKEENVSVITGTFDQAGLLGLLRRLYYLGVPLISVNPFENRYYKGVLDEKSF